MRQVELRLPDIQWRQLRAALGTNKTHFSSPEHGRPNFVMTVGVGVYLQGERSKDAEVIDVIVIKAEPEDNE